MAAFPGERPLAFDKSACARVSGGLADLRRGEKRKEVPSRREMHEVPVHHSLLPQDLLQYGPVRLLVQKLVRITRWYQQSINPTVGPSEYKFHAIVWVTCPQHEACPHTCSLPEWSTCCCGQSLACFLFPSNHSPCLCWA